MKYIKHILFISFFIIICGEQIQMHWPIITARKLKGDFIIPPPPTFTFDNWFSGNYQDSVMKNYEYDISLHVPFVRLRNQIGYSLFDEVKANALEVGKNEFLFGSGYIENYFGKNFNSKTSDNDVKDNVTKMAYVQAELKKRNVDLIFLITPGKPALMPDLLPEKYDTVKVKRSFYDSYVEQLKAQKLNFIDYRKVFLQLKPQLKHPVFPKLGVHWSGYGATIAADTLIKYMENLRHISMIKHVTIGGTETNITRDSDNDVGELMNLIYPIPSNKLYYPIISFVQDKTKTKPNVLIVGDSFVWSIIGFYPYFPKMFGRNSDYWYYNEGLGFSNGDIPANRNVKSLNLKEQTFNRDFILIMFNEANLHLFNNGFVHNMYTMLKAENATAKTN